MSWRKGRVIFSIAALVFLTALIIFPAQAKEKHTPAVKTNYGVLKGFIDDEVIIWKGVPYAKPPIGELRWKAPQDPEPWRGIRQAVFPANKCTQLKTTPEWIRTGEVDPESSEDCLYLDIYRPNRPAFKHEKLPVYVWIHGGSNNFGSAREYDGSILAARSNVVVVIVQYRLGPMGWFYHPAMQTGGIDKLSDSGNLGTLDHIQALKWVRENIDAFGGDPKNITITGESAGAHNVMNLVISPLAKGLFHKAMSQSGGMYTKTIEYARNLANRTIEQVIRFKEGKTAEEAMALRIAMENDGTLEDYLRAIDAGTFFLAIIKVGGSIGTYDGIEDGTVLPFGGWMPAIKAGNYNKVPIILGSNEYESKSFMPLYGPAVKLYGIPSGSYSWFNLIDVLKGTKSFDEVLPTDFDRELYEITGYYGSRNWRAKYVDTVARELANKQMDVYAYLFKWGGPGSGPFPFNFIYGAGHAMEIAFFFGSPKDLWGYSFTSENERGRKALQSAMMRYLANFAWTGNPNSRFSFLPWGEKCPHLNRLPKWQKWSNAPGGPKSIVFDADLDEAKISMMNEELSIEGVRAELEEEIGIMPTNAKAVARLFQFFPPW